MKPIALVTAMTLGSLSQLAPAASSAEIWKSRCAEKERQIVQLEKEIDSLHALLRKQNGESGNSSTSSVVKNNNAAKSGSTYTIAAGDTLSKIAKKNGISLKALMAVNSKLDPRKLRIGQTINLPAGKETTSTQPATPAPERLTPIATQQPAKEIAQTPTNEVLPAPIPPAQHAEIPNPVAHTETYVVQKGDTLYSIARNHKTTVANILEQNQKLDARRLSVGQSIQVATTKPAASTPAKEQPTTLPAVTPAPQVAKQTAPEASSEAPKVAATAPVKEQSTEPASKTVSLAPAQMKIRTVSVNRQMTFGEFASAHGASVEQINEMNNLKLTKNTVLAQGSELYIPNNQL